MRLDTTDFFVRLNMGSRYFLYVAAQVVQINGEELQALWGCLDPDGSGRVSAAEFSVSGGVSVTPASAA